MSLYCRAAPMIRRGGMTADTMPYLEPIRITARSRVVTRTGQMQGRPTMSYLVTVCRGGLTPQMAGPCHNPSGRAWVKSRCVGILDPVFCRMPSSLGLDASSQDASSPLLLGLRQNPARRGPWSYSDRLLGPIDRPAGPAAIELLYSCDDMAEKNDKGEHEGM